MPRIARCAVALAALVVALIGAAPASAGLVPVAVDDAYSAVHGKLRTVAGPGVLGNDLQVGDGFTVALTNDVDHGTLDLDPDGGFTYRSDADYVGADTFRYRVDGGLLGLSNVATVTITVTNDPPRASPDAYTAVADVERSIGAPGVLRNDDDDDGDDLTVDVVQEPANGNLNEDDDGSFRYKADDDFSGTDTWRYRVWDGFAWSNTTTVTMTVSAPAATPTPTPPPTPTPTPTRTPGPSLPPVTEPSPSVTAPGSGATRSPTPSPTPATPGASTPGAGGPGGSGGPGGAIRTPTGASPTPGAGSPGTPQLGPFSVAATATGAGSGIELDPSSFSFVSFEWAVPALVLTVPGILIIIAVLSQAVIGLAWLPLTRRWLGGDRRRRQGMRA